MYICNKHIGTNQNSGYLLKARENYFSFSFPPAPVQNTPKSCFIFVRKEQKLYFSKKKKKVKIMYKFHLLD